MITFISAVPGGGKTLTAVEILYNLSKDNVKNLNFNYYLFKPTIEKLTELNLLDELRTVTITTGQGLEQETEIKFFDSDYFDFLLTEYRVNVVLEEKYKDLIVNYPDYYFERVLHLNAILQRVNEDHDLKFQLFKTVRPFFTNIAGLMLAQARPLPEDYDWRKTPFGSFIAYDEAQLIEIFSDETKKVDPIVKLLTKHRHWSYDFLFISQDPSLVHRYIRKLCGHHIHLLNAYGFEQSIRFEWSICQEQPNALRNLARAESNKLYRFPKQLYQIYKSTTASTRVKRHPWKKYIVIGLIGAVGLYGVSNLFSGDNAIVALVTGGKYGNETVNKALNGEKQDETNQSAATSNNGSANQSDSDPRTDSDSQEKTDKSNINVSGINATNTDAVPASEPVITYDVSDPWAYNPPSVHIPVNARTFAGCAKWEGKYYGFDQQGTIINELNKSDCERLLKHSYNRPFDYFGNRSAASNSASYTRDGLDSIRSTETTARQIVERSGNGADVQPDAATKIDQLPFGSKPPQDITGAHEL